VSVVEGHGEPIADSEVHEFFRDFWNYRRILLAISGGPDSTALLWLTARWKGANRNTPQLIAVTVDHRLRKESKQEAAAVAILARKLKIPHYVLAWSAQKPKTGLQEAARTARYGLLLDLARKLDAAAIVTAHTLDDQAETILHRIARGSGLGGLAGMGAKTERDGIALLRPLIGVPKSRLIATLRKARVPFTDDPTNRDSRFLRPRLRQLAPELAKEGIDASRLSLLAGRLARAHAAIESVVSEELVRVTQSSTERSVQYDARTLFSLPAEISLRLLGRAINRLGHEGPAELGKLETLHEALVESWTAGNPAKRTLAGALVSLDRTRLDVTPAPLRRNRRREHSIRHVQANR
jgi:tRNA(Ile)-lysidine synthase